jgi:tetratricopeptide (TPR) repeat protein
MIRISFVMLIVLLIGTHVAHGQSACGDLGVNCKHPDIQQRPSDSDNQQNSVDSPSPRERAAQDLERQGTEYYERQDYNKALEFYQRAYDMSEYERFAKYYRIDIARTNGVIDSHAAAEAYDRGDYATALKYYQWAVQFYPYRQWYVAIENTKKKIHDQERLVAGAAKLSEDGREAFAVGDYELALSCFKVALLITPGDATIKKNAEITQGVINQFNASDNLTISREIAGVRNALQQLNKSMSLDASQREEWMHDSEMATRDAWILAGTATLDLWGAHVDHQIQSADQELKRSVDLLAGTVSPNRREQLHTAFKILKRREDELKRLRSSIDEYQQSYGGAELANKILEGKDKKVEVALEAMWKSADKLKLLPPGAAVAKDYADLSYLVAIQAASVLRIRAINERPERYLDAIKVLKVRMEKLVKAQRDHRG